MSVAPRVEVSWEDQRSINLFNRLHVQHMELQAELKVHKKNLEDLEDASNELILVDDDTVRYAIGSGGLFLHVSLDEAEQRLEKRTAEAQDELEQTRASIAEVDTRMDELKTALYAKFGNTINLEP